MQKILRDLRQEIDQIDNQIIALFESRKSVVNQVARLKKENKEKFFVKQAREADMIKNLISKPGLKFPKSTIIDIWRKLITAANIHEQPLSVALHNPKNIADYNYLIREYYNNEVPIIKCDSAQNVLSEIERGIANIGVFALPKDSKEDLDENWWINLVHNKHNLKVFAKIPFAEHKREESHGNNQFQLVVVAEIKPEKSLDDNSLLCIELNSSSSKTQLINLLNEHKLNFKILKTAKLPQVEGINFYLVEVDGFIEENSELFNSLNHNKLKPYVKLIGHYAKPIVI
jgi:chorismate mutase